MVTRTSRFRERPSITESLSGFTLEGGGVKEKKNSSILEYSCLPEDSYRWFDVRISKERRLTFTQRTSSTSKTEKFSTKSDSERVCTSLTDLVKPKSDPTVRTYIYLLST